MKTVLTALGLSVDADELSALNEVQRLASFERDVLDLTKAKHIAEALGALTAMKSAHEQVVSLTAQLAKVEGERTAAEIKSLLDEADKAHKLPPAKRPELEALAAKSGVEALRVCLSMMSPLVEAPAEKKETVVEGAEKPFTALELSMARAFVGDDTRAIAERIRAVRKASINPIQVQE